RSIRGNGAGRTAGSPPRPVRRASRRIARLPARPPRPLPDGERGRHLLDRHRTGGARRARPVAARSSASVRGGHGGPAEVAQDAHQAVRTADAPRCRQMTTPTSSRETAVLQVGAQVMLRPLANPLPLGFLALAVATLLLSAVQLQWLPIKDATAVAVILVVFVAPLQLLTSILGFLARDPVAGTGMGILAGTWAAVALVTLRSPVGTTSHGLGLLLLVS